MIPINEKLSPVQVTIMDMLAEKPMSAKELGTAIKVSDTYARIQVQRLESAGRVTKIDTRIPYVYRINENDPASRFDKLIKKMRFELMTDVPTDNSVIVGLRTVPKEQWPDFADKLAALSEAIRLLDGEGALFDTL